MSSYWLQLTLKSECCPASGDGVAGLVDIDLAHDHGLPLIPAKRIKGCLRDIAMELQDWGIIEEHEVERIFGKPGTATGGVLLLEDAKLFGAGGVEIDNYDRLIEQITSQTVLSTKEILQALTTLRTRTAIDENTGNASVNTLRTMRVIHKDTVFRCKLELTESEEKKRLEEVLNLCCKGLRHIGLGKTRGLGEVQCELLLIDSAPYLGREATKLIFDPEVEIELPYLLQLVQPVMIAGDEGLYQSSEDWITGSAIQGALAAMYIADYSLGKNAHENADFSRIFLRGGVSFGYAFPYLNGLTFTPSPASWRQRKDQKEGYNLVNRNPPAADSKDVVGATRSIKKLGYIDHSSSLMDTVHLHSPEKEIRMHHARPKNRGIGRALGPEAPLQSPYTNSTLSTGVTDYGQFFQYVSLRQGQTFAGTLRGLTGDVQQLLNCLASRQNVIRLGRSRTAEYGMAIIEPGSARMLYENVDRKNKRLAQKFVLTLQTPLIVLNEYGYPQADPFHLRDEINLHLSCRVDLKQSFVTYTQVAGYNSKWRLPKPQQQALGAGTVLVMESTELLDLNLIEKKLWGMQTGEGYGRLIAQSLDQEKFCKPILFKDAQCLIKKEGNDPCLSVHPFLELLTSQHELLNQKLQDQQAGRLAAAEICKVVKQEHNKLSKQPIHRLPTTKLHQLLALSKMFEQYNDFILAIKNMQDDGKREQCERIVEPCSKKNQDFRGAYLEFLKLEWRKEENESREEKEAKKGGNQYES